jgi:tetratricopeptide (TPR) repeat protein
MFQELAISTPHRFQAQYAMSLHNYSGYLSVQGERQQALVVSQQALNICKELVELRPERFNSNFAWVLRGYGDNLKKTGKFKDSLSMYKDSLRICQELAGVRFSRFSLDLFFSIVSYANGLANLGDIEGALSSEQEALGMLNALVKSNPGFYLHRRERCQLNIALWQWLLSGSVVTDGFKNEVLGVGNINLQRGVEFYRFWLLAWVEKDSNFVSKALSVFSLLNSSQQRDAEEHMFLLIKLAEKLFGESFVSEGWRGLLVLYREKMENNFPVWMVEVAKVYDIIIE